MIIDAISLGGFENLGDNTLELQDITSLVAPNNYGKSNVLDAVEFGVDFIQASSDYKTSFMKNRNLIPINTELEGKSFHFEISGRVQAGKINWTFIYGYSFVWAKSGGDNGAYINEEHLKLKTEDDSKFKSYINRTVVDQALFLASPTGRCAKQLVVDKNILALNKLGNFDDLFYIDVIKELNHILVKSIKTMADPGEYFNLINPEPDDNEVSLDYPKRSKEGYYITCLKEKAPDEYELLRNTIMDLLPNIEDIKPVVIDLKHEFEKRQDNKLPFQLPERFYDVRVKEKYNNQYTSINRLSSGCKRILFIMTLVIAARLNKIPLILLEELENSVHPKLLQNLLSIITELAGDTKVIITSHSPYLIKYLDPLKIEFGLPYKNGVAVFKKIKASKVSKLMKQASAEEVSLGEYLFEMMLDTEEDGNIIKEYFC
jgi:AAA15 family ATPase/GTPase